MCLNRNPSNTFGRRTVEERHLLCEFCCTEGSLCNRNLDCGHTQTTCEYLLCRDKLSAYIQQDKDIRGVFSYI